MYESTVRSSRRLPALVLVSQLLFACGAAGAAMNTAYFRVGNPDGNRQTGSDTGGSTTPDGRYVVFLSTVDAQGASLPYANVFVQDRQLGFSEIVSVSGAGAASNGICYYPSISQDGRYVAYSSDGDNLVPGDTNDLPDTFVRDRLNGTTERVSVSSDEVEQFGGRFAPDIPVISGNGRFVVFASFSNTLVPDDNGDQLDVFVRDREAGTTERVTVSSSGEGGDNHSFGGSISADGRYVCFDSYSSNFVDGDTDELDVFVRDRQLGTTERVTVSSSEVPSNGRSERGALSADGRFVAFMSLATNLVPQDTNGAYDVFVRDRLAGTTERVSVAASGEQGNGGSGFDFGGNYVPTRISGDGRFVLFNTTATNLVRSDSGLGQPLIIRDRATQRTEPAAIAGGKQMRAQTELSSISANGRYLVLTTTVKRGVRDVPGLYLFDRRDPGSGKIRAKSGRWKPNTAGTLVPGTVTVTNTGKGSLTFSVKGLTGPFQLTSSPGPFTLAAKQSHTLAVTFQALEAGKHDGTLTLSSDDPRHAALTVKLRAVAR